MTDKKETGTGVILDLNEMFKLAMDELSKKMGGRPPAEFSMSFTEKIGMIEGGGLAARIVQVNSPFDCSDEDLSQFSVERGEEVIMVGWVPAENVYEQDPDDPGQKVHGTTFYRLIKTGTDSSLIPQGEDLLDFPQEFQGWRVEYIRFETDPSKILDV